MRQTVGFDRFNDLFESLLEDKTDSFDNYPPYNIEKSDDDHYRIVMAVAGFKQSDIEIVLENGSLTITGEILKDAAAEQVNYLHRGIATRNFKRAFKLEDHIKVVGADLNDGLLEISLQREIPEERKPRSIPIGNAAKVLGSKKKK